MEPEKKDEQQNPPSTNAEKPANGGESTDIPANALEKTNEELAKENVIDATNADGNPGDAPKELKGFKKILKKFDIYLAGVVLLIVLASVFFMVSLLNSKKAPKTPTITSKTLTQGSIKDLGKSNVTINNSAQTLTVEGNAVFIGQVLIRNSLAIAGDVSIGGTLNVPNITVTNLSNLNDVQIKTLQIATDLNSEGNTKLNNLSVTGLANFAGPITAPQISVRSITVTGSEASLNIPGHIAFTGPPPSRTNFNQGVLGSGGTASIGGSDTAGVINVSTGNGPGAGCFLTVTFVQKFAANPKVFISPIGPGAGASQYYITENPSSFTICMNTPPANDIFQFNYFVVT